MNVNEMTDTMIENARKAGDDLMSAGRRVWLAGLGVMAFAEERVRETFDTLVDKGEDFGKSERNVIGKTFDDAADRAKTIGKNVEDGVRATVQTVLSRAGVPSRDEVRTLIDRVEKLTQKVESMKKATAH